MPELDLIRERIWVELGVAATQRGHPWRTPVLATVGGAAGCDARVVVLREVDAEGQTLLMFTDARSPKATQIVGHPGGVLVMWSADLGWQLRLRVHLTLCTSGLAVSSRWARLKMSPAAHDYLSPLPPGAPLAQATPARGSREHFAVLSARVLAIDWLDLAPTGHRRACFEPGQAPRWLQP